MKKVLAIVCSMLLVAGAYALPYEVNEKVLKSFKETFAAAEEVKWEEYSTYYTVSFVHSGIRSKVNYDKDGNMLGSIRYYAPQMLPLNIYNKLRKDYSKKGIVRCNRSYFRIRSNILCKDAGCQELDHYQDRCIRQ